MVATIGDPGDAGIDYLLKLASYCKLTISDAATTKLNIVQELRARSGLPPYEPPRCRAPLAEAGRSGPTYWLPAGRWG